ncbi:MAG: hypothetical protein NTV00_00560 [Methylococcales bacterium]|nr:hypothetical protein [Methylococcales bacterium]
MTSKPPQFTPKAATAWLAIHVEMQQKILDNVYCPNCRSAVSIVNFSGSVKSRGLLLDGSCSACGHKVARYLEDLS